MGFDLKFTDNSGLVLSALDEAVGRALEEIGQRGEGHAVQNAPVGTPESTQIKHYKGGSLKNSITHKVVFIFGFIFLYRLSKSGASKYTKPQPPIPKRSSPSRQIRPCTFKK